MSLLSPFTARTWAAMITTFVVCVLVVVAVPNVRGGLRHGRQDMKADEASVLLIGAALENSQIKIERVR
jgi:hypothetical protein